MKRILTTLIFVALTSTTSRAFAETSEPARHDIFKASCKDGVLALKSEWLKANRGLFNVWLDSTETREFLANGVLKGTFKKSKNAGMETFYVHPDIPIMITLDAKNMMDVYVIDTDKKGGNFLEERTILDPDKKGGELTLNSRYIDENGTYGFYYNKNKKINESICASGKDNTLSRNDIGMQVRSMRFYVFGTDKDALRDNTEGKREYSVYGEYPDKKNQALEFAQIIKKSIYSVGKNPGEIMNYFLQHKDKTAELDAELTVLVKQFNQPISRH